MIAKCNWNYGLSLDKYSFNRSVEIWIDTFVGINDSSAEIKIFIAVEPEEIMKLGNKIRENAHLFDYVLTFEEELLSSIPNAVLFEYGTKWAEIEEYVFSEKKFEVSFVCGHKRFTSGHKNRQKLWMSQDSICIPKNFFLSQYGGPPPFPGNKVLGESKLPLFDSMFHICMENTSKKYYFTEKIIDSMLCKSVPIYIGCTNIGDYFNTKSILTAGSVYEVIDICNSLTIEDYISRADAIEDNHRRCYDWIDLPKRMFEKIQNLIDSGK